MGTAVILLREIASTIRLAAFDISTPEGRSKERYRRAILTSLASALSRVISIVSSLISVSLTLRYLGPERYGLWMTISAVIAFMGFSDLGINNSLMNGIAKACGRDDRQLAKQYVSSAFFILIAVVLVLAVAFAIVYPRIPWTSFFRVHSALAMAEAGPAVVVFTGCFLLNILAGIVSRVQSGYQEGFVANLWGSLGSILSLLSLLLAIHFHGSLALLVLAMAGAPILALLMNGAVLFHIQRPWLFPSWRYVESNVSKDLMHVGVLFFVLSIAGAVGFSADNIVLVRILGPEAVAQYAVPCRLFSLISIACSFIITPLWPAYGEALERRDFEWISRTLYRSLLLVTCLSVFLSTALAVFGNKIIQLWVGPSIHPSPLLLVGLAIWGVLLALSSTVGMFLNGLSVVKFQVVIAFLGAFTNITLSVYLTKRIGIPGVVYGSIISQLFIGIIPYYWFVRRYIKNRLPHTTPRG